MLIVAEHFSTKHRWNRAIPRQLLVGDILKAYVWLLRYGFSAFSCSMGGWFGIWIEVAKALNLLDGGGKILSAVECHLQRRSRSKDEVDSSIASQTQIKHYIDEITLGDTRAFILDSAISDLRHAEQLSPMPYGPGVFAKFDVPSSARRDESRRPREISS
ncbi:hypothetical protein KCU85_g197, partial [Aureobasidium melanogenum]